MSRSKKKSLVLKSELGKAFDRLPVFERRAELFARARGTHTDFYRRKILKKGTAKAVQPSA